MTLSPKDPSANKKPSIDMKSSISAKKASIQIELENKKIIFAGTPEFAATSLEAIIRGGHSVELVLTQPDRPAGRGRAPKAPAVKSVALNHGIPVWQPASIKGPEAYEKLKEVGCDFMVVVAYGLIVPELILSVPKLACINLHASLLPRWRGAAPIQRSIEAGDLYTGVCVMQMEKGLDTGPVVSKVVCPIEVEDTSEILHDRLSKLGADALLESLNHWNEKRPISQRHEEAVYAKKIEKSEAEIDWSVSARTIGLRVRAFNPWPVCFTFCRSDNKNSKEALRIWQVEVLPAPASKHLTEELPVPGTILGVSSEGIKVMTGEGVIMLTKIQRAGSKSMSIGEFTNGHPNFLTTGLQLGAVSP